MAKYTPNDYFAQKARQENYPARSVYKLQEINNKYQIIPRKGLVLDLGASPGSWSLFVSQKNRGKIIALDLKPLEVTIANLEFYQLDIFGEQADDVIVQNAPYDLIISDMAPSTTGMRFRDQVQSLELIEKVAEIALKSLARGGNLVFKYFESEEATLFVKNLKQYFKVSTVIKPKSTRNSSYELFFVGKHLNKRNGLSERIAL